MDMSQYRTLFINESREHLHSLNELIVALEEDASNREKIDSLFRAAHSLKGMAASMEYLDIAALAHKMEDLMDQVRQGTISFDSGIADLLLESADVLDAMLTNVENDVTGQHNTDDLIQRLTDYEPAPSISVKQAIPSQPPAAEPPPLSQSVGQPLPTPQQRDGDKQPAVEPQQTVRVKTERLDHLVNLTGELITNKYRLMSISSSLGSDRLNEALADLSKLLRSLCDEVMQVRMMPFSAITDRFPRVVRDLAKKEGKDVVFTIEENAIELDRSILENLADPLIHILRNSVDHGIESSEERLDSGKPARGNIRLFVRRDKDQVIVTVSDDGRGMDPAKLVAAAVNKGVIKPEEARLLSPQQALMLICTPGFSTALEITDVSGRGVGMDAVKSAIQSLGGALSIESKSGRGSRITLKLPLTIAIIHALIVKCAHVKVAVPVTSIIRTVELKRDQIMTSGKQKIFRLDDEQIPLVSLNRLLRLPLSRLTNSYVPVFVSEAKGRKVGFVADRFLGQQELFVKPLGRPLGKLAGITGGATLGDGEVVFVLDTPNLL